MTTRAAQFVLLLFTAAALIGYAGQGDKPPAPADKASAKASKELKQAPSAPSPVSGAVVFVDPVTRQIRQPDPSEIGVLAPPATPTKASAPVLIQGQGTAVGVVHGDETLNYMVVTKTADGKVVVTEATGSKAAEAQVKSGGTQAKQPPQR